MNPYAKYQESQIKTADPGRLILMIYDGAIIFLQQSKDLIKRKDFVDKSVKITKVQDILIELMAALNMEAGSVAINLKALYAYMIKRLFDANGQKDVSAIDETLKILVELREAWDTIINRPDVENKISPNRFNITPEKVVQL